MPSTPADWLKHNLTALDETLERLVKLNSFSDSRRHGQQHVTELAKVFSMPGVNVERVPSSEFADHLIITTSGGAGRARVGLIGHSDTVFPPGDFEGYRREGTKRMGPGVFDMKGGLVSIAFTLRAVAETVGLSALPSLSIVIVSDEEVGSREGAPLIRRALAGHAAALVFEPGRSNDSIVVERQGTGTAFCHAHGKAAHAGNAYWEGASAIWALSRFVDKAQQLSNREQAVIVNIGTIEGGTSKNTVAANAKAGIDLRFLDEKHGDAVVEKLNALAAANDIPNTRLEMKVASRRPPMRATEASRQLAQKYSAVAQQHGLAGGEAPLQGGASDGNTAAAMGLPTIDGLGPRGGGFHTHDEFIDFDTLVARTQTLTAFLLVF